MYTPEERVGGEATVYSPRPALSPVTRFTVQLNVATSRAQG